jgi:Cys-tRNA(Pro)/Cys-tRNA(Cys) deacylase
MSARSKNNGPSPATPAIATLRAAGVAHEVVKFGHDQSERAFGDEAVRALAALGVSPGQVFKTLVVASPRGLSIAVVPVPARLSLKAMAAALGTPRAEMADPAAAQRTTGYVVGAISPLGTRKRLPTVVDATALNWDRMFCSAGRRGWDIALAPQDLIRLTSAVAAEIGV